MTANAGIPISVVNHMEQEQFAETFGGVFEHAPWVAKDVWAHRPFYSCKQLHDQMMTLVRSASEDEVTAFFRGHPDLATRLEVMTPYSVTEQQGAGLSQLTQEEHDLFTGFNRTYTEKFGFPFIMAVRGKGKDEILAAMKIRIQHTVAEERQAALEEIAKVTAFRIGDLVAE
ncbi:2-oxo-4-hydroxy-4-carboxy-5-ureidoimidazoline decarboxylase [Cohnella soli]|uniref:2-oxo-4-hydroxy-4-carboxy-5-ureidoimidazoline decarboxylase n=1 Tax=Cohnella soli TaxID=425005 RepID=A0ABW0HS87_9BACL